MRAEPEGKVVQPETALAELGREGLTGEQVRPGVSPKELAHRTGARSRRGKLG